MQERIGFKTHRITIAVWQTQHPQMHYKPEIGSRKISLTSRTTWHSDSRQRPLTQGLPQPAVQILLRRLLRLRGWRKQQELPYLLLK
jgi:hypothetical protein